MGRPEVRLSREEISRRHVELGKAAMKRFLCETSGPRDLSVYDRVEDADKIQLAGLEGRERWEVIVVRYGKELELRQLLYSDTGQTWQTGCTFYFDIDVLEGLLEPEEGLGEDEEPYLADEAYFVGLTDALRLWPLAEWCVMPVEARFD